MTTPAPEPLTAQGALLRLETFVNDAVNYAAVAVALHEARFKRHAAEHGYRDADDALRAENTAASDLEVAADRLMAQYRELLETTGEGKR